MDPISTVKNSRPYEVYRESVEPDGLRRELRERRVLPLLGIFLASGFLVLEGVDQLTGRDLIHNVMYSIAIVFYAFGIPGTVIIAWFHGQKGPQRPRPIEFWMHGFMLVGALGISYGLIRGQAVPVGLEAHRAPAPISSADRTAIEEVMAGYSRAVGTNDWALAAEYTSADAVWIPPNESATLGRVRVFGGGEVTQSPSRDDHQLTIHELSGAGGLAYVRGLCNHGGGEGHPYLLILKKQEDGLWRIIVEMWGERTAAGG